MSTFELDPLVVKQAHLHVAQDDFSHSDQHQMVLNMTLNIVGLADWADLQVHQR